MRHFSMHYAPRGRCRPLRHALLAAVLATVPASPLLAQRPGTQGLNPDISAIGDLFFDLSPTRPKFTEGERFALTEVELGIQAFVDPFFRADFFLGLHDGEIEVEEGYVTALSLPGALQARLGRFALPFGKASLIHRPELVTVEYPHVIQQYFGPEGLRATGIGVSRIFAPLGLFQELQVYALSGLGEAHAHEGEEEIPIPPDVELIDAERSGLEQFAFMAHLRTYKDLSPASNIEVGLSAATSHVERFRPEDCPNAGPCPAVLLAEFRSQRLWGANVIYRWRPPEQAIYRSFQWSAEVVGNDGPEAHSVGLFTQAQVQLSRRTYLGARFDAVQGAGDQEIHVETFGQNRVIEVESHEGGEWFRAASGYFTFFPSEFSRFRLGLERSFGESEREWRAVLQTTFSIGPHRPHAF